MNQAVVAIDELTKSFDQSQILKQITTQANTGEIIALLGLNGAGKTTLLETMLGFCLPDQGSIKLFGQETNVISDQKIKHKIGFVPQQEELITSMRVDHYLKMIGSFYTDWDEALVSRLCEEWELPINKKIRILSTGQRQKVAIIAAIAFYPQLIILDEPVASLDPKARQQFLRELIDISNRMQSTIIFSTHIVSDVERIADRLWMLKGGKLVLDKPIDEIKEKTVRLQIPINLAKDPSFKELTSELMVINQRQTTTHKVIVFSGWNDKVKEKYQTLCSKELVIETLSLEDIFLEMNR